MTTVTTLSLVTTPSTAITITGIIQAIITTPAIPRRVIRTRPTGAWRSAARQGLIASKVRRPAAGEAEVGEEVLSERPTTSSPPSYREIGGAPIAGND